MNKPGSQIKQTNNHRNLSLFHFDGLISKLRSVWRFLFVPASVWKESNLVASAWTPDQTNISIPICFIWANWEPLSVIFIFGVIGTSSVCQRRTLKVSLGASERREGKQICSKWPKLPCFEGCFCGKSMNPRLNKQTSDPLFVSFF